MVRIEEGECQTASELPANGRFTRPRQTDQRDQRVSLHNTIGPIGVWQKFTAILMGERQKDAPQRTSKNLKGNELG